MPEVQEHQQHAPPVHVTHLDGIELIVLPLVVIAWFSWRIKVYVKATYRVTRYK